MATKTKRAELELPPAEIPDVAPLAQEEIERALAQPSAEELEDPVPNEPLTPGDDSPAATAAPTPNEKGRDTSAAADPSPAPASSLGKGSSISSKQGTSLTGKKYKGLKNEQLQTLLADRDADLERMKGELAQIRERLAVQDVAGGPAGELEELQAAAGITCSVVSHIAGAVWGPHCVITPSQETRLGDAWGKALAPYLHQHAKHAPLFFASILSLDVLADRYMQHRMATAPIVNR